MGSDINRQRVAGERICLMTGKNEQPECGLIKSALLRTKVQVVSLSIAVVRKSERYFPQSIAETTNAVARVSSTYAT